MTLKRLASQFIALTLLSIFCSAASAQVFTDKAGFNWDFTQAGDVTEGTEDAFDGGYQLQINGNQFTGSTVSEKQGMFVFGPQTLAGVEVTRHAILIEDPPGVFYAEQFFNNSAAQVTIRPSVLSDFGEAATSRTRNSDDGKMLAMLHPHGVPRPHLINVFGVKGGEYLPSLTGTGDTYQFEFPPMELQAGEKKSIGYFVAQRTAAGGPGLLADTEIYSRALEYASSKGSFNFPNSFGAGIFSTGKTRLTKPAKTDFIATKKNDLVYGKLMVEQFELETELGNRTYTVDQIINIIGAPEGRFRVVGSDGSILDGKLSPEKIKFELSDGIEGEIEATQLDRIVPKLPPTLDDESWKKGKWFNFTKPVFVFTSGERLTGIVDKGFIVVHSEIGKINLPTDQLVSIKNSDDGKPSKFLTKDGQTFSGLFYDIFEVKIFDGTVKKIAPKNLSSIFFDENRPLTKRKSTSQAYLKLSGSDFLYVKLLIEKSPLEFATAFGNRKMNPEQIKSLKTQRGFKQMMDIVLWDGSKLRGELSNDSIWVEVLGREMEIPASQIDEFNNPMALPPKHVREKYIKLIGDLGNKKYDIRAHAIKTLGSEKEKLRGLLKSQLDKVSVEAKAQIWQLLPPQDRPKKEKKKPNVKKASPSDGTLHVDNPPK